MATGRDIREAAWDALVANAPCSPYQQRLTRKVPYLDFAEDTAPSYLFCSGKRNRCNPNDVECVYFSEDSATAHAEYSRYIPDSQPSVIYSAEYKGTILDFEKAETRKQFLVTNEDLFRPFRRKKDITRLQKLGLAITRQNKITGIRFPSAACQEAGVTGYNIVIFKDAVTSPDSLCILGPGDAILEQWPAA